MVIELKKAGRSTRQIADETNRDMDLEGWGVDGADALPFGL